MRTIAGSLIVISRDVVDFVLTVLHPLNVLVEANQLALGRGAGRVKAIQLGDLFLVGMIFTRRFFETAAKLGPETLVFFRFFLGYGFKHRQYFLDRSRTNPVDQLVVLQYLSGYIQRQIVGVDYTSDESQITRHKLLSLIHNKDTLYKQFDAVALLLRVIKIKGRALGYEQQSGIFLLAFHSIVRPGERFFVILTNLLVEFFVVFVTDLVLGTGPQGGCCVNLFELWRFRLFAFCRWRNLLQHHDRKRNVVRIFFYD